MDLSQHVDVRHEVYLTTELKQGIAVLQMSAADLADYVNSCMEENPFLDEVEGCTPSREEPADDAYSKTVSAEECFFGKSSLRACAVAEGEADGGFNFDRYLVCDESLEEHLLAQIGLLNMDGRQRAVAEYVAGNLDENGYLDISVGHIADCLQESEEFILGVLDAVRRLDPVGVASQSLAECVGTQLSARGQLTDVVRRFLDEHLSDFAKFGLVRTAKLAGMTVDEVEGVIGLIRTCDPRPGARFAQASDLVWPEVIVREGDERGVYTVALRDFYLPELRVNTLYKTMAGKSCDKKTAAYLKEKLKEAESLLGNIRYRSATLHKVACCIVEVQSGFFDEGPAAMRPLTMAQVAQMTGLSESTVSRVSNGNYMQTPRGVYELRYFFQKAASSSLACDASQASVKSRIRELVAGEDPRKPLSDQSICDMLQAEGMDVSRRTVNKYRCELGIAPRAHRRRIA